VRLLYVGRFTVAKNVETLIDAVALLAEREVGDFELELVGEGAQRPVLERQVAERGLARRVHFSDWVPRDRIADYYRRADIFVTATTWRGCEYRPGGDGVWAADRRHQAPGLQELVEESVNGYLVPIKDAAALADALALLIDNGYERRRMGRQSRLRVERQFAWSRSRPICRGLSACPGAGDRPSDDCLARAVTATSATGTPTPSRLSLLQLCERRAISAQRFRETAFLHVGVAHQLVARIVVRMFANALFQVGNDRAQQVGRAHQRFVDAECLRPAGVGGRPCQRQSFGSVSGQILKRRQ
jgi:hypothetical protein